MIGPNGAGKTTAFNCITGVYEPTNGLVEFMGKPIVRNHPQGKMKKNYKGQNADMYLGKVVANTTIKTRPQPKPKEKAEPVMPKAPKPEKKYEEPDLEALFQETAANLSEKVAEEEAEEPAEQAAEAETAEQPMDPESEAEAREAADE